MELIIRWMISLSNMKWSAREKWIS